MLEQKRTPNKNGEFLLDVVPTHDEGIYTIYDITAFLPHWQGYERKRVLSNLRFTIKGNKFSVLILDSYEDLTEELARTIAKEWYCGNTTYYRLD